METEKMVLLSGVCAALVVITYILFGPPVQPARKKGRVGGLVNVGESCFLNSLLQALGSMPVFVEWLASHRNQGALLHALHTDLAVVNGVHPCVWEDPYLPANVIRTLHRGWDIPGGEQDVHELFNVITTTLDEEVKRAAATQQLSLCDALDVEEEGAGAGGDGHGHYQQHQDFPAVPPRLRHGSKSEYAAVNRPPAEGGGLRLIRSEASELTRLNINNNGAVPSVEARPVGDWAETRRGVVTVRARHHRRTSSPSSAAPCEGLLTTQTHCVNCHYRSPVKYDSFKYVPLLLPSEGGRLRLTLYGLLDRFTSTEVVSDVRCEGCNHPDNPVLVLSDALKVSNFGKLPKCLAFHIQRTVWTEEGPFKRFDFVEFPEILSMGSYTYSEIQRRKLVNRSNIHVDKGGINRSRNIFLLQAVIKHEGTADKGHFVTFRRCPVRPRRWYYTSDCDVHETDLERVLEAPAYMLFYTRCS